MRTSDCRGSEGFTLIEVLVVMGIVGALSSIAAPNYMKQRWEAEKAACQATRRNIEMAEMSYYAANSAPSMSVSNEYACPSEGVYVWLVSDPEHPDYPKVVCSKHSTDLSAGGSGSDGTGGSSGPEGSSQPGASSSPGGSTPGALSGSGGSSAGSSSPPGGGSEGSPDPTGDSEPGTPDPAATGTDEPSPEPEITAETAPEAMDQLIDTVVALDLPDEVEGDLLDKLEKAKVRYERGRIQSATATLGYFGSSVRSHRDSISDADEKALHETAQKIREVLMPLPDDTKYSDERLEAHRKADEGMSRRLEKYNQ